MGIPSREEGRQRQEVRCHVRTESHPGTLSSGSEYERSGEMQGNQGSRGWIVRSIKAHPLLLHKHTARRSELRTCERPGIHVFSCSSRDLQSGQASQLLLGIFSPVAFAANVSMRQGARLERARSLALPASAKDSLLSECNPNKHFLLPSPANAGDHFLHAHADYSPSRK